MSFSNWLFVAEINQVSDRNIHIQLVATNPRHPRQRAVCTYVLASELESIAHAIEATWAIAADPSQGRIAVALVDGENPHAVRLLLMTTLTIAGFPLTQPTQGN